ncbi:MAG: hypothetical protein Athens101410_688 [Parcubacteria group bacterium Athens1014_10]|nr:MAG: hypothetical protein Athens101410_688 [Parcubacteria group bacterium Athens1014_10]TSD04601.1 MAG: hypothetical protein Athens071412_738 [Parcubacteria group bacterium Athens0714_12]
MQIIKCNKCGKVKEEKIPADEKWLRGSLNSGFSKNGYDYINFDLCKKCSGKLATYVKNYLGIKKAGIKKK